MLSLLASTTKLVVLAAHQDLMDAVAQKMTDLGVPTAELGFAPLQTLPAASVFQQCARAFPT